MSLGARIQTRFLQQERCTASLVLGYVLTLQGLLLHSPTRFTSGASITHMQSSVHHTNLPLASSILPALLMLTCWAGQRRFFLQCCYTVSHAAASCTISRCFHTQEAPEALALLEDTTCCQVAGPVFLAIWEGLETVPGGRQRRWQPPHLGSASRAAAA